jgi:methyltransferase (TIGR00027 family)
MGSAVLRAAHVREDAPPWVLEDTLSERLLDRRSLGEVRAEIARWAPQVRAAFRLAHAVRSRLAEDIAIEGLAVRRRDYVLLGAGLDTFAWRHPEAGRFRIWEIDHPATQRWKRRALSGRQLGEPANVRFVPVDLATLSLGAIETPATATWNWLGVTMYLDRSVTEQVLKAIARRGAGTTLVVNFVLADDEADDFTRAVQATAAAVVARDGEPPSGPLTPGAAAPVCWREPAFHRSRRSMRRHSRNGTSLTAVNYDYRIRPLFASPESDRRASG